MNTHLFHWGLTDNNLCTFCNKVKEMYTHLFIMCDHVQDLWLAAEEIMQTYDHEPINFVTDMVMWNRLIVDNPKSVKNLICLVVMQYIYRSRRLKNNVSVAQMKNEITSIKNIEKFIAKKNQKISTHNAKWGM